MLVLLFNIFRGPSQSVVATQNANEKRIEVVVAVESIEAGQPLEKANLALQQRPINTLPADAITSFEALKDKVAAGPIPAGYPLSMAFLAEPVPVVPIEEEIIEEEPEDPRESILREIEKDTVATPVQLDSPQLPPRGARVAIILKPRPNTGVGGEPIILLADAWVSKSDGRGVTLRVSFDEARYIDYAKSYGTLSYLELPLEGNSPYASDAIKDMNELRNIFEPDAMRQKQASGGDSSASSRSRKPNSIVGYAWVTGGSTRFGLDKEGGIHPLDEQGNPVGDAIRGPRSQ